MISISRFLLISKFILCWFIIICVVFIGLLTYLNWNNFLNFKPEKEHEKTRQKVNTLIHLAHKRTDAIIKIFSERSISSYKKDLEVIENQLNENIEKKTLELTNFVAGIGESIYINLKAITELHHEALINQFDEQNSVDLSRDVNNDVKKILFAVHELYKIVKINGFTPELVSNPIIQSCKICFTELNLVSFYFNHEELRFSSNNIRFTEPTSDHIKVAVKNNKHNIGTWKNGLDRLEKMITKKKSLIDVYQRIIEISYILLKIYDLAYKKNYISKNIKFIDGYFKNFLSSSNRIFKEILKTDAYLAYQLRESFCYSKKINGHDSVIPISFKENIYSNKDISYSVFYFVHVYPLKKKYDFLDEELEFDYNLQAICSRFKEIINMINMKKSSYIFDSSPWTNCVTNNDYLQLIENHNWDSMKNIVKRIYYIFLRKNQQRWYLKPLEGICINYKKKEMRLVHFNKGSEDISKCLEICSENDTCRGIQFDVALGFCFYVQPIRSYENIVDQKESSHPLICLRKKAKYSVGYSLQAIGTNLFQTEKFMKFVKINLTTDNLLKKTKQRLYQLPENASYTLLIEQQGPLFCFIEKLDLINNMLTSFNDEFLSELTFSSKSHVINHIVKCELKSIPFGLDIISIGVPDGRILNFKLEVQNESLKDKFEKEVSIEVTNINCIFWIPNLNFNLIGRPFILNYSKNLTYECLIDDINKIRIFTLKQEPLVIVCYLKSDYSFPKSIVLSNINQPETDESKFSENSIEQLFYIITFSTFMVLFFIGLCLLITCYHKKEFFFSGYKKKTLNNYQRRKKKLNDIINEKDSLNFTISNFCKDQNFLLKENILLLGEIIFLQRIHINQIS